MFAPILTLKRISGNSIGTSAILVILQTMMDAVQFVLVNVTRVITQSTQEKATSSVIVEVQASVQVLHSNLQP